MIRRIEKRNYRTKLDECWNVSDQLESCVKNSENFGKLNRQYKNVVQYAIGKRFLGEYIRMWGNPLLEMSKEASLFYNEESTLWGNNGLSENLKALKEECNLYSLHECCKATFTLDSLEGNYENFGQKVQKQ